jgi:hypothetical protein
MTTTRTETILALETVAADSAALLDQAIAINQFVRAHRLPLGQFDLAAIHSMQMRAEVMLLEMELRATVAA